MLGVLGSRQHFLFDPGPVLHPPIGPARSVTNLTATSALGACTQTHAFPWRITHSGQFEFNRIATNPSSTRVRRVPPSVPFARRSLAYDPVPVTIAHVPVRGVRPVDGCDPVPARLLARDPAVPVVVVASEHVVPTSAPSGISCRCRCRPAHHGLHRGARAALKDPFERRGLSPVHGEPVGALHLEHPSGEPAPVPARDPFTGVVAALLPAVHLRGGEREVARSWANCFRVARSAAQSPESCASLVATMCSMSVSVVEEKHVPV